MSQEDACFAPSRERGKIPMSHPRASTSGTLVIVQLVSWPLQFGYAGDRLKVDNSHAREPVPSIYLGPLAQPQQGSHNTRKNRELVAEAATGSTGAIEEPRVAKTLFLSCRWRRTHAQVPIVSDRRTCDLLSPPSRPIRWLMTSNSS